MDHNEKKDLSTSSFQQKIFDWFDKRGMLSELRSHLRHQMITAFQNSSISNRNSTGRFTVDNPISPALQAFLLLVAEFLAQQEYNYTVSVLVAEVPVLATFPKFAAHVSHLSDSQLSITNRNLPKYPEKDVLEILETLGIDPNSESSHHIVRLYLDSAPRESLLACILTALPAVTISPPEFPGTEPPKNPENLTYYIEEIRLLLLRAKLDKSQLRQLEDVLRRFYANASAKARQEERELCLKEAETTNQQLRVWENAARQRQRNVELELEESKRQLKAVTEQLRDQHDCVLRRLHRVQKHAEDLRVKEEKVEAAIYGNEQQRKHLNAKNEKLIAQQARLEDGFRSLQEERENLQTIRAEIQSASQMEKAYISSICEQKDICAKLQTELEKTRAELNAVRLELKASTQIKDQNMVEPCRGAEKDVASKYTQTELEKSRSSSSAVAEPAVSCSSSEVDPHPVQSASKNAEDRRSGEGTLSIVRHLRQENTELQERNTQLQRRLEEVTEQAAIWASSPSRIIDPAMVPRPPVPPPPPPLPLPPQARKMARSCELGAGEELGHPPVRQPSSRDHTLHLHGREWKRIAPRQLLVHVEPSEYPSSDESVSEEVLRETGRRLRHLDAESELIDRRRKELKESVLTNTGSYMFIPTASTPTLPPPPAARPYEPGNPSSRLSLLPPDKSFNSLNFGLHDSTLGRFSQVTWPDVHCTSTPIRLLDSPLRRGVKSHLSLSRDRRSAAESMQNSEERVPTSPLRSTERNAFLRLDAALDNIKLAREDIKHGAKPDKETNPGDEMKDRSMLWDSMKSVPNEETNVFHPDTEFESPSNIRDRVMATLRASTSAISGLGFMSSPASATDHTSAPAHIPPSLAPAYTPAHTLASTHTPAPTLVSADTPALHPDCTSALTLVHASTPIPALTLSPAAVIPIEGRNSSPPGAKIESPYLIQNRIMAKTRDTTPATSEVIPSTSPATVPTPVPAPVLVSADTVEAIPELEEQPVDVSLPFRVSSMTMPKLPLAPPVIPTDESPKDSTLNEISTPASSPSLSYKAKNSQNLSGIDVERKGSSKERRNSEDWAKNLAKESEKNHFRSDSKRTVSPGGTTEVLPLKAEGSDHVPPLAATTDLSESFIPMDVNIQQSLHTFKDKEPSFEEGASSNSSRISAGSVDNVLKDDSW